MVALCAALVQAAPAYHFETAPKTAAELAKRFTDPQIEILEMLNRRDPAHLTGIEANAPGLLVPSEWSDDPYMRSARRRHGWRPTRR